MRAHVTFMVLPVHYEHFTNSIALNWITSNPGSLNVVSGWPAAFTPAAVGTTGTS